MIVVVDVGSGSVRAAIVDDVGVRFIARRPGALPVLPGSLTRLNLDEIWARIVSALREAAGVAEARGYTVDAITCTSVRYATVWSSAASELGWANVARADQRDVSDLQSDLSSGEVLELGGWPTALSLSARIVSAARWGESPPADSVPLSLAAWVLGRLDGDRHIDPVTRGDNRMAGESGTWGVELRDVGSWVGDHSGTLIPEWRGAALVVSPPDTVAAALAFGTLVPGDAVAVAGTTTPVVAVADAHACYREDALDDASWLPFGPGQALAESNAGRTGDIVRSMAALGHSPSDDGATFQVGAVRTFLGPTLVPPRRLGERPVPLGIEFDAPIAAVSPGQIAQSVLEANAWATAVHLRRVAAQAGATGRWIICGGQTQSEQFIDLLAAAAESEIEFASGEVTVYGAALSAGAILPAFPTTVVRSDGDVGNEPQLWAHQWWDRYNARSWRDAK